MSKKLTYAEFIANAKKVHGDVYDYSKSQYVDSKTKLEIICKLHGSFWQSPNTHTQGRGCKKCGTALAIKKGVGPKKKTTEEFILDARKKHGDTYDYSKVDYRGSFQQVLIICSVHGEFSQMACKHSEGCGCPKCFRDRRLMSTEEFITRAKELHGEKYDYSRVACTGSVSPVEIGCPVHGWFNQIPASHLNNGGCKKCGADKRGLANTKDLEFFIITSKAVHGDRYDYSESAYVSAIEKIAIRCRTHGLFSQAVNDHYKGHGCPVCKSEEQSKRRLGTLEKFTANAVAAHGDKYDYSKGVYLGSLIPIEIICPDHGSFFQSPCNHASAGSGCPKCVSWSTSEPEKELAELALSLAPDTLTNCRTLIAPKELDIVVPSAKLAIEYCGLYWHRTTDLRDKNYHLTKLESANSAGLRLITIFEDEWITSKEIVKQLVSRAVGARATVAIGARNCSAVKVDYQDVSEFYSTNHLQGPARASTHMVLLDPNGSIAAAASFSPARVIYKSNSDPGTFELVRFCQRGDIMVHGGLKKLCSEFFKVEPSCSTLLSFVDRRWFTGTSYVSSGFEVIGNTSPGYWYIKGQERHHRYKFAKHLLKDKLEIFDEAKSEVENMLANKYLIIHDCGNVKLRLSR
jgi:hypothetical protein